MLAGIGNAPSVMEAPNVGPNAGLFAHLNWQNQGNIWRDITSGDDWERSYRPYDDEPLRSNGATLCSESLDGLSAMVRVVERRGG
jgi:hypothetical protein